METNNIPAPPVYAARLSQLLKTLDTAHTAVKDAITARSELVKNLESLLETNKIALAGEQQQLSEVEAKRKKADDTKRQVENKILSGLGQSEHNNEQGSGGDRSMSPDGFKSPIVEALTPPAMEDAYEPTPQPALAAVQAQLDILQGGQGGYYQNAPDLLSTLSALNGGNVKRSVLPVVDEMGGMDELDSDVADMLRKEAEAAGKQSQTQAQEKPGKHDFMMDEDDEYHP